MVAMQLDGSGIQLPDSRSIREAEQLVRAAAPDFLVTHSLRTYAWGAALAQRDKIRFDPELLCVASLLHDVGLVAPYDTGGCFERDGADAAAAFAAKAGWPDERCAALASAIRLHMAVRVELLDSPEAYLLWHATGVDVTGHRLDEIDASVVRAVIDAYPRLEFKRGFTDLFRSQATTKPHCRAAEMLRAGFDARIESAPFDS